jgi:hypothetical protein
MKALSQSQITLRLIFLGAVTLLTLACGFMGTGSEGVVMLTRLPTFTRTPLPPLAVAITLPSATMIAVVTEPLSSNTLPTSTLPLDNTIAPESAPGVGEAVVTNPVATPVALATPALTSADSPNPTPLVTSPPVEALSTPLEGNLSATSPQPTNLTETPGPTETAPGNPTASLPTSTFTPPLPTVTALQTPIALDTPTAPPTAPTNLPPATATPILEAAGWAFIGVQSYPNPEEESVILYGDVVNNTGSSQALVSITGTFYDGQGQVIADEENVFDYWPVETLPPGGRAPFELTIYDVQNIAKFDLSVAAEASNDTPRQDFEILGLSQSPDDEEYCLSGTLRNQSDAVGYLIIIATFYDAQDNVISFGEYYKPTAKDIVGNQTLDFEVCGDTHNLTITNYEVYAWGQ